MPRGIFTHAMISAHMMLGTYDAKQMIERHESDRRQM